MIESFFVPVVGAVCVFVVPRFKWQIALLCTGITFGGLCTFIPVYTAPTDYIIELWMNPLSVHIFVDGVSLLFALITCFLFLMAIIYSSYMKSSRYFALLLLDLEILLLLVFSNQLIIFYILLELSAAVTYFLVIYKKTEISIRAGFKYIVMNVGGAVFILTGILLIETGNQATELTAILIAIGCLVKAGSFPFHTWLADAHPAAPSPVSALLSGAMVKVGVYGIFRFVPLMEGTKSMVLLLAAASMVAGAGLALIESDIKRLLAYSTVSQVGFILLGLGLQSESSISGGLLHMANHGLFKGLLFLSVGCVIYRTGERNLNKLGGLLREMPVTGITCLVACLSISGIPPFNGFVSKTILYHALNSSILQIIFVIACAGTVASFTKLFRHVFLGSSQRKVQEVSYAMRIPLIVLSGLCIVLGVNFDLVLTLMGDIGYSVWGTVAMKECLISISLGLGLYYAAVKARILENPPQLSITVDGLLTRCGDAVNTFSSILVGALTRDINYYVMYMVIMILGILVWFHL